MMRRSLRERWPGPAWLPRRRREDTLAGEHDQEGARRVKGEWLAEIVVLPAVQACGRCELLQEGLFATRLPLAPLLLRLGDALAQPGLALVGGG